MESEKYCWSYGVWNCSGWDFDTAQAAYDNGTEWLARYKPDASYSVKVYRRLVEEVIVSVVLTPRPK